MKSKIHKYQNNYLRMCKNTIALAIALLISVSSFAQGLGFNYKAVIKDDNGNVMTTQNLKLKFAILGTGNNTVYEETHTTTTDANGIAIVVIGQGTEDVTGAFYEIDWANDLFSLKVDIDTAPYDVFVPLGTTPFQAAPYAFHASKADSASIADNVTGLEQITEGISPNDKTGWRLRGFEPEHYGNIGEHAVDLSHSTSTSSPFGATGFISFAAGNRTRATAGSSTALGFVTIASGTASTALGASTEASGDFSTTMGWFTTASGDYSTAMGTVNVDDPDALLMVGNGANLSNPNNVFTVYKDGTSEFDGDVRINDAVLKGFNSGSFSIGNVTGGSSRVGLYDNDGWEPTFNDTVRLGASAFRWTEVWSVNPLNTSSDRRLKKEINPINYGLDAIMNLKPISYKWIKGKQDTKLGFIAQDVKSVVPEIVKLERTSAERKAQLKNEGRKIPEVDYYAMSYTELIPVLVKAMQELKTENDHLKQRIEQLENR